MLRKLYIFFLIALISERTRSSSLKYTCSNVGGLGVFYDETCSSGQSLGCNAGGQGQNCRFCGFDNFPPCPVPTTTTTSTRTTTASSSTSSGQETTGSGPMSTNAPIGINGWENPPNPLKRKYVDHPLKRPSVLDPSVKGPLPTNSWYQNLLVGTGEQAIQLWPTLMKAKSTGVSISQITKPESLVTTKQFVLQPFVEDWVIKATTAFSDKKVADLKELSVLVRYSSGSGGKLEFPLVNGNAFVTAIYTNLNPALSTVRAILSVKVDNSGTYKNGDTTPAGKKFVVNLNSNTFWVIYSSNPISFRILGSDLVATSALSTVLKIGLVGETDTSLMWDRFANGYVQSADFSYSFNGNEAELVYYWNVVGSDDTLMLALPHHVEALKNPEQKTSIKSFAIKGEMTGISGKSWKMRIPLSTISWTARKPIDSGKKQEIRNALLADQNLVPDATDPYFFGVEIGRTARLALIADELGESVIATKIRNNLISALTPWLEGTNISPLRFDKVWGGMPTADGLDDPGADFGNGYYNDHYFHYGYHVYAAAVIAKQNPQFYQRYAQEINYYIRDYANPSRADQYFPLTRHKDWFCWHSWAAGLYEFADSRNQESTSEAVNAYYAVSLMGKAILNQQLDDFGRLLTAMEVISTKAYWQMPSSSKIYPELFKKNLMVGILWGTKVDYATFFGANDEYIHGIQFLPFTPMTEEYLDPTYMQEEKVFLDKVSCEDDWLGYLIEAKAVVDKENQWSKVNALKLYHPGNSKTNTLYWIATR